MRNPYMISKGYSVARDQLWRWTPSSFFLLPKAWRKIGKDQGRGSSKGGDFQRRYSRTFGEATDGVISLYNFRSQICDKHGIIKKVKPSPQCEEISYL